MRPLPVRTDHRIVAHAAAVGVARDRKSGDDRHGTDRFGFHIGDLAHAVRLGEADEICCDRSYALHPVSENDEQL